MVDNLERPRYITSMAKTPKRPRDVNQLARHVVALAVGDAEDKKPLASARKGGLIGSKARNKSLTPQQRSEIARVAASARWKKSD